VAQEADLKSAVLDRVRNERFGGISATAIFNELKPPVGKVVCTLAGVVETLESLIADGVVYEVEPAEYAIVKPPEPLRPTVVDKIKLGQKSLF
jgi:hypothetical protein